MNTFKNKVSTEDYAIKAKQDMYSYLSTNFDDETIETLVKTVIVTIEEYLESIKTNITLQDPKELLSNFHAFQGMLMNLGLNREAETAKIIQNMLKDGNINNINPHVEDFTHKLSNLLIVLQNNPA
jgi:HPt (histidine-containing phosphotransfer) domain-containing protein